MWSALRLLPLAALVAVGAAPHPPQVAFEQLAGLSYAILLTDQTGTQTVNLTAGKPEPAVATSYSWAPDGSRLVYVGDGKTLGGDLEVLDPDARTVDRITSGAANSLPVWSPDGSRIAYVHTVQTKATFPVRNDSDVWVVAPDGSGARQVTHDGGGKSRLAWAPDGSSLIVPGRGGAELVALSTAAGLDVANADGSNRHRVAGPDVEEPVWSPDGTRIAFSRSHCTPGVKGLCGTILSSVYVAAADGSGERRLTGPIAGGPGATDDGFPDDYSYSPVWWPDGRQLLFLRSHDTGARTMNADGTCERRFGPSDQFVGSPSWRPGSEPTVAPRRCVDLRVRAVARKSTLAVHERGVLDVVVENDGNEPATGVTLALRLSVGKGTIHAPRRLGSLAPGASRRLVATVVPRRGSRALQLEAAVHSDPRDPDSKGGGWTAYFQVLAGCDIAGTPGADRLTGTPRPDRICALPGDDVIRAGAGGDTIEAGAGYDRIYPGPGRDRVEGGEGRDTIYATDGERDIIDCGPYRDTAYVDREDVVKNCERVHLRAGLPR